MIIRWIIALVTVLILGAFLVSWFLLPIRPKEWDLVRVGQNEEQVLTAIDGKYEWGGHLSSYDTVEEYYSIGLYSRFYGNGRSLIVTYDSTFNQKGGRRIVIDVKERHSRKSLVQMLRNIVNI